jgi:MoaA/NifB/PqqE/SkfB family radical SAM enzyme
MDVQRISFTAANSLPLKMCKNTILMEQLNNKIIPPVHAQVIPTNQCNLSCKFCSCAKRDKSQQLTFDQVRQLADDLQDLGCEAVTITGGGEPLIHPLITTIIRTFCDRNMHVGLVTNGLLFRTGIDYIFNALTWCRVSCCDERKFNDNIRAILEEAYEKGPGIDWAFSYVLSTPAAFDLENLIRYIQFANEHEITHIRVVSDLLDVENSMPMDEVRQLLANRKVDDSRVIYQGRKEYDPGQNSCYISLLKPVIGADGYIYPCCGVQYARGVADLDMVPAMRMGRMEEIKKLYRKQSWFNGAWCTRCYYKSYNEFIGIIYADIKHKRFV